MAVPIIAGVGAVMLLVYVFRRSLGLLFVVGAIGLGAFILIGGHPISQLKRAAGLAGGIGITDRRAAMPSPDDKQAGDRSAIGEAATAPEPERRAKPKIAFAPYREVVQPLPAATASAAAGPGDTDQ